jgi:uncharacterized protein DUF2752
MLPPGGVPGNLAGVAGEKIEPLLRMWFTAPACKNGPNGARSGGSGTASMSSGGPGGARPRPGGTVHPAGAWRPGSAPEQLGLAGLGAAAAAFAYQRVGGGTGLLLPCPLRTLTGIPCPMCGMTTAATGLAGGDLQAAVAANPLVLILAGLTLVMAVLMVLRAAGWAGPPAQWPASRRRQGYWAAALLAAASWAFQLHRFGWV